ncbi:ras association domain-containing protein 10 [Macrotis lagotis]|uniref:ras association domain-containing protein 10 n=1 Tax=Macrotis lagotis TaxID=92651 RepID=UPI003D69658D
MEPPEEKISVWVCQEEKVVSGLSRRTTCSDVVRALLEDSRRRRRQPEPRRRRRRQGLRRGRRRPGAEEGAAAAEPEEEEDEEDEEDEEEAAAAAQGLLWGGPRAYCIVEKWRGFERILPNKTRLLRLWAAWGAERANVRFVLVPSAASLPHAGPRSAEARVVLSKGSPGGGGGPGVPARPGPALTQERQRRLVRKAFRKLAKLNGRRPPPPPPPPQPPSPSQRPSPSPCSSASTASSSASSSRSQDGASGERMETLVHLVLSQDHTLRQQVQRLRELDREIERFEARVHLERVRRHGVNYLQDTYLVGPAAEPEGAGGEPEAPEARAEYARRCEQLLQLQEQRARQEELLERLAAEIQEELNQRWMRRRQEELAGPPGPAPDGGGPDGELLLERERLKTQLSTSLYIGLRLSTDLEAVKSDLDYSQRQWELKDRELRSLLETLDSLDFTSSPDEPGEPGPGAPGQGEGEEAAAATGPGPEVWVDQARGLAKGCQGDEDSDTGLSSMHSQDSDSVPVSESLV